MAQWNTRAVEASLFLSRAQLYTALVPAEENLSRKINPTLYTSAEFERRRKARNGFITRVLEGELVVLVGDEIGPD